MRKPVTIRRSAPPFPRIPSRASLFVSLLAAAGFVFCGLLPISWAGSPQQIDLLTDPSVVRLDGEELRDKTGTRVAACDINGDGVDDLVIGAPDGDGPNNSRTAAGEVYLVFGWRGPWFGPISLGDQNDVWIYGQQALDGLGIGVGCGDVNGDGFGDIVLGAPSADGMNAARLNSGQAHIIFGSPSMPEEIDLLTSPGTILYGAAENDGCSDLTIPVGDVTGDGIADIILAADDALNHAGTASSAGQVHIAFGRYEWPESVDLLTESDVTIYGASYQDFLGRNLAVGDLDNDGTAEVLAVAQLGDGPSDERSDAGDIYVFKGRSTWPTVIDLAIVEADMLLYGPDPNDSIGGTRNLAIGDLDGDSLAEIAAGSQEADGRYNETNHSGEARIYEPTAVFPPVVDLDLESDSVIYGEEADDFFCSGVRVGDINGDGTDDLVCDAVFADGPDNSRPSAAEIHVFFGRNPFPAERDVAEGDQDLVVFGAQISDRLALKALADVNNDGLEDIIASTCLGSSTCIPSVWIISPFDTDGDGVSQLQDNCPRMSNADQADGDDDLVGDQCDNCPENTNADQRDSDDDGYGDPCDSCPGQPGSDSSDPDGDGVSNCTDNCPDNANPAQDDDDSDGIGDACDSCPGDPINDPDGDHFCASTDNCPWVFNPAQADQDEDGVGNLCDSCPGDYDPEQVDGDGDGAGDACDCQDIDPNDRSPALVEGLQAAPSGSTAILLSWKYAPGSDVYSLTRGELSTLGPGQYGNCLAEGVADTTFEDPALPQTGDGFSYLVQGQNFDCGIGSLGHSSQEEPRNNPGSDACQGLPIVEGRTQDESSIWGTVIGDYTDTQSSDDNRESITEVLSPGTPAFRFSVLEHHWTIWVEAGDRVEFHVEAYRTNSQDGDSFLFEYSTNGGTNWAPIQIGNLPLFDDGTDRVANLPSELSGTVIFRVIDSDHSQGHQDLDVVTIDEIFVRSIPAVQ